jgi:heptosyltransferase-2
MRRILVVTKFRYMGDTIVATPLLRDIARGTPGAEITVLGGPPVPSLLQGCPHIKQAWSADPRYGNSLSLSRSLVGRIRAERFDTALLVNRSLHSSALAYFSGIPERIGHDTEHRGLLLTKRVKYDWSKPDRDCALDLVRAVGIETGDSIPQLWVTSVERENASALLSARGIHVERPIIVIQPGANDPFVREWGARKFAELGDRLAEQIKAEILILGTGQERTVGVETANTMRNKPIVLSGDTDIRQALAIVSLSKLWVGNDGGMLHAAVGLGPATVGIFGPTKARRWGYNTPKHRTVCVYPENSAKDAATIRKCLDAITVETVFDNAIDALAANSQPEAMK